jgi:hypothetical protein
LGQIKEGTTIKGYQKGDEIMGKKRLRRIWIFLEAHTQSIAYLIGEVAAEKIIEEYGDLFFLSAMFKATLSFEVRPIQT